MIKDRVRNLFPPNGIRYELFDTSVLIFFIGLFAYTLSPISEQSQQALAAPLYFVTEMQLGVIMTLAGAIGLVTSYSPRWFRIGYIATISMTLALSLNYFVGIITAWVEGDLLIRPIAQVIIYAWIGRRLMKEVRGRE